MQSAAALERGRLERGLAFLATVGNNAPFVGLFGTVVGVIHAFEELGHAAPGHGATPRGRSASQAVMASIAEALVATAVGIARRAAGGGRLQLPAAAGVVSAVGNRGAVEPGPGLHRRRSTRGARRRRRRLRGGAAWRRLAAQDSGGIISGINVTPLVDVMLVLLVIFIVTAKIIVTPAVPLDLPHAAHGEEVQVVLSVILPLRGPMLVNGAALPTTRRSKIWRARPLAA